MPIAVTTAVIPDLSDRQREIWIELAQGKSAKEIARRLELAEPTVKKHTKLLFRSLGVRNKVEAALAAYRQGLVK